MWDRQAIHSKNVLRGIKETFAAKIWVKISDATSILWATRVSVTLQFMHWNSWTYTRSPKRDSIWDYRLSSTGSTDWELCCPWGSTPKIPAESPQNHGTGGTRRTHRKLWSGKWTFLHLYLDLSICVPEKDQCASGTRYTWPWNIEDKWETCYFVRHNLIQ